MIEFRNVSKTYDTFTAGVGEKSPYSRGEICKRLNCLGVEIKGKLNNVKGEEVWSVDDLRPLLEAHPELAGMRCNQLPDKIYSKDEIDETTEQYTYTFDKDGYVESCTEVSTYKRLDNNETRTETTIYTFTWEQSSETITTQ